MLFQQGRLSSTTKPQPRGNHPKAFSGIPTYTGMYVCMNHPSPMQQWLDSVHVALWCHVYDINASGSVINGMYIASWDTVIIILCSPKTTCTCAKQFQYTWVWQYYEYVWLALTPFAPLYLCTIECWVEAWGWGYVHVSVLYDQPNFIQHCTSCSWQISAEQWQLEAQIDADNWNANLYMYACTLAS